jgi:hypothetical protein
MSQCATSVNASKEPYTVDDDSLAQGPGLHGRRPRPQWRPQPWVCSPPTAWMRCGRSLG